MIDLDDVEVVIPSHRPVMAEDCARSLLPLKSRIMMNDGRETSIANLFNGAIATSRKPFLVVACDKTRGTIDDVRFGLDMIDQGYALVGLHAFRFLVMPALLFPRLGRFDDGYVGGSYSDCDYLMRMCEADIAYYESRRVKSLATETSWPAEKEEVARERFMEVDNPKHNQASRFRFKKNEMTRLRGDDYRIDLSAFQFRPWRETLTFGWNGEPAPCSPVQDVWLKDIHPHDRPR